MAWGATLIELSDQMDAATRNLLARRYTESAEAWLRRLLHHHLSATRGLNYITGGPWRKEMRDKVATNLRNKPGAYPREIDATTFDQLVVLTCHPKVWPTVEAALREAYPDGREEARTFLNRLRRIRNIAAHVGDCTARDVEQAVCYTNDLADAIKNHFRALNMGSEFDVPTIVKFVDSLGNVSMLEHLPPDLQMRVIDWRQGQHGILYFGDRLVAEVEIDETYPADEYMVEWSCISGASGTGSVASIELTDQHIGESFEIRFVVKTKRDWHRGIGMDDYLVLLYKVLPRLT